MRYKEILTILAVLGPLLSACEQPRKPPPVIHKNPVYIETGYLSANRCACPSASQYYIYNASDQSQTRTVEETINDINSPGTQTELRKFEVPARGKKFLRCSPALGPTNQCLRTYSWRVDGTVYAQSKADSLAVSGGEKRTSQLNCRKECIGTDGQSPFCLDADVTGGRDTKAGLSVVKALAELKSGEALTKKKVLGYFGKTEEPCNRTSLTRVGNRIINSGDRCEIGGRWGANNSAKLVLPAVITPTVHTDRGLVLDFEPTRQVTLKFGSPGLDRTYGGAIRRLEYYQKRLVVSTTNGCVSFKLER